MASESKGSDDGVTKITLSTQECSVESVTVFSDRAEVTRQVKVDLPHLGDFELLVEGLPESVDTDSVRVNGSGHVTLQEVSYGVHHKVVVPETATTEEEGETNPNVIRTDITTLKTAINRLRETVTEVQLSQSLLDNYTQQVLQRTSRNKVSGLPSTMEFAFALMDKQQTKTQENNEKIAAAEAEIAAKQKLVMVAEDRLNALGQSRSVRTTTVTSRDVTIVLTCAKPGSVKLNLIYMVSKASWAPAYDARINSVDTNVVLTYYGMVQQNTGEDWTNAKVVLSTATPSVGGTAPVLPTKHVGFHDPTVHYRQVQQYGRSRVRRAKRRNSLEDESKERSIRPMMNMQAAMFDAMPAAAPSMPPPPPAAAVATSKVESSGGATTFHIEHRSTINSDNKEHKVTVGILELAATFRHYAVPSLQAVAYLQCLTTNSSAYTLLASNQVSVFLDGSFVSKSTLVNVAPGEKFRTFLGVDSSVRVEFRRVSSVRHEKGYFNKSQSQSHKFTTSIKNARDKTIHMVVADMLPVSDDGTIKVKLVSPTQEAVTEGTKMMELKRGDPEVAQVKVTNNLVWQYRIPAGGSKDIDFEYLVEHPANRTTQEYQVQQGTSLA